MSLEVQSIHNDNMWRNPAGWGLRLLLPSPQSKQDRFHWSRLCLGILYKITSEKNKRFLSENFCPIPTYWRLGNWGPTRDWWLVHTTTSRRTGTQPKLFQFTTIINHYVPESNYLALGYYLLHTEVSPRPQGERKQVYKVPLHTPWKRMLPMGK